MTRIIQCPETLQHKNKSDSYVFLAGGITGCPDWQTEIISMLKDSKNPGLILINPRRKDFDVNDPNASDFQITWEFNHLKQSDIVSFWFPEETLCPITLYELGVCAALKRNIIVGCHPNYKRIFDVTKQLELLRPEVIIYDSLEMMADTIDFWAHF